MEDEEDERRNENRNVIVISVSKRASGHHKGRDKKKTHLILDALIKQIPMKVEEIHVDEYRCPACGAENTCGDISLIGDSYCPECGQAIYQQN